MAPETVMSAPVYPAVLSIPLLAYGICEAIPNGWPVLLRLVECSAMLGNGSEAGDALEQDNVTPLLVLYALVVVSGLVGNISLIAALASAGASRLRTPQLLSACAADLLVCGASAPLAATRAVHPNTLPCLLTYYIETFPVTASTLSLAAMATDRYLTVRRGRGAVTCARPMLVVGIVWFAAIILGAVAAASTCAPSSSLAVTHALLAYVAPAAAALRCHWAVRAKLTALSLTARAAHGELPLPVPLMRRPTHVIIVAGVAARERRDAVDAGVRPSLLGPQPHTSTLRSRRRLGNALVALAAIFAGCWAPHAVAVLAGACGARIPRMAQQYALLLGHAHSALCAAAHWTLNRHALRAACAGAARRPPRPKPRDERPSSTNEAALGAFHPRLSRPAPAPRPPPSSFLY